MTDLSLTVERIKDAVAKVGVAQLAKRAGVPYTTLMSFATRGWTNKNFANLEKLANAAEAILAEEDATIT